MERQEVYIGFPALPEPNDIIDRLLNDPPDVRWRIPRMLFHIKNNQDRETLIEMLRPHLYEARDFRIKYRITLALQALHRPIQNLDYHLVKGKGAFKPSELADGATDPGLPQFFPVVDFHIHPKTPDLKFFSDFREAGVTHGVILATDTDPEDVDRSEVGDWLEKAYKKSPQAARMPFENLKKHIKASLYSPTHVTNQDVADWIADYPEKLFGFGSVNMSKDRTYVEKKLEKIERLGMRGIKFLPHSQFFNPSENENMDLLFDFCRQTGTIILSHSGCGPGPFEVLELSQNSHPALWERYLKKYPDVTLILAHFGAYSTNIPGIWLYEAMQLGQRHKNVFADISAVTWILDRENVVREIRKTIGFDRVLFATDYPLPLASGVSLAYIVSGIRANMHLTEKEKRKVLGENAAKLLRIS